MSNNVNLQPEPENGDTSYVEDIIFAKLNELRMIDFQMDLPEEVIKAVENTHDKMIAGQILAYHVLSEIFKSITSLENTRPKKELSDEDKAKDSYAPPGFDEINKP